MQSRIKKETTGLSEAACSLIQTRAQYPKFPQIREALVLLKPEDKIRIQVLSKFTENFTNLVREQAETRAKEKAKQAKKEAEVAAARIRWEKQLAAAKASESANAERDGDDDDDDDNEEEGGGEAVVHKQRKRKHDSDSQEAGKSKDKTGRGLVQWQRKIMTAKRAGKTNPTSGYDPRNHVNKIQERPSPTKLNKVLGSDVMKKQSAGPSFKIPKKYNYRAICPPPGPSVASTPIQGSAPDCPSFVDDTLDSCVYDPLAEILGSGPQQPKKKKKQVREDIARSPERPQSIHTHVQQIIDYLEDGEPDPDLDGGTGGLSPEDILGPDEESPGLRLYSGQSDAPAKSDRETDHVPDPDDGDDDPVEPEAEQEDQEVEDEEPEAEAEPVDQGSRNGSMLVDHDELDYGGDDDDDNGDDEDEEDEDDDGNFKRGRKAATDVPAKQRQPAAAAGIVGLLSSQPNKSGSTSFSAPSRPMPSSSSSLSVSHAIRAPVVSLPAPGGRKQVVHDDVEPDVDADAKAKRAARFAATKQIYQSKATKITIPNEAPPAPAMAVAPPAPPVTPAAPVIRKGTASKVALLKDPPPRSFSPDPDVEPDISPVIRPKTRKPVQIMNTAVLIDSEPDADLFAPPEKVLAPVPTLPPTPVVAPPPAPVPAVPDTTAQLPPDLTPVNPPDPSAEAPAPVVVTPVTRVDPRLEAASARRTDPRLAARQEIGAVFAPPVATVTVPDSVPSVQPPAVIDLDQDMLSESLAPTSHPLHRPSVRQSPRDDPVVIESPILATKPPAPRSEESPFNELLVKNKVFIHLPAERSTICFRTCYDDAPPEDIPFTASPGVAIPDPRILIQVEKTDPRLREDSDDEDVPIFGEQEPDEQVSGVAEPVQRENGRATPPAAATDLFKIPIGPAPRSKKKTTTTMTMMTKKRERTEKLNGVSVLSRIQKPAALLKKGPQSLKAKPLLLISEINDLRRCMKPKKLLWERLQEAKAREDDGESSDSV